MSKKSSPLIVILGVFAVLLVQLLQPGQAQTATPTQSPTIPPTSTPSRSVTPSPTSSRSITPSTSRTPSESPSSSPPPDNVVSAGNPRFYAIFFPALAFFFVIVLGTLIVVIPLMVRTVRVVKQRRIRYHRPTEDDTENAVIDINAGVEEWHGSDNEDDGRRGSGDDRR